MCWHKWTKWAVTDKGEVRECHDPAMTKSGKAKRPRRVQRLRKKGWRMPPNTIYVGRPTYYGNPFRVGNYVKIGGPGSFSYLIATEPKYAGPGFRELHTAKDAVDAFREYLSGSAWRQREARQLRGKNLACWCPLSKPCHADILLEIANAGGSHEQS